MLPCVGPRGGVLHLHDEDQVARPQGPRVGAQAGGRCHGDGGRAGQRATRAAVICVNNTAGGDRAVPAGQSAGLSLYLSPENGKPSNNQCNST